MRHRSEYSIRSWKVLYGWGGGVERRSMLGVKSAGSGPGWGFRARNLDLGQKRAWGRVGGGEWGVEWGEWGVGGGGSGRGVGRSGESGESMPNLGDKGSRRDPREKMPNLC